MTKGCSGEGIWRSSNGDRYLQIGVDWEEMEGLGIVEKIREDDGKLGMLGKVG